MPAEYATLQQLRAEGVVLSDAQLRVRIQRASAMINNWCRRWFYPKQCTFLLDGQNSDYMLLQEPIISIQQIRVLSPDVTVTTSDNEIVPLDSLRVYNRHLSQNLLHPDDRVNPKIQYASSWFGSLRSPNIFPSGWFPAGTQNIEVKGLFGYTEPDDGQTLWTDAVTPVGRTPDIISLVCMMLVTRDLLAMSDLEGRNSQVLMSRLTQERTRDQSVSYSPSTGGSAGSQASTNFGTGIAGNAEIKALLAPYVKGPGLGSA